MVAVVSSGMTWLGNYLLNSPAEASAAIELVDKHISNTDQRVSSLEADNKTLKEWLTRVEGKLDLVIREKR